MKKILLVFTLGIISLIIMSSQIIKATTGDQNAIEVGKQYNVQEIIQEMTIDEIKELVVLDSEVITISETGVITPLKKGSATVVLSLDGETNMFGIEIINNIEEAKRMYTICVAVFSMLAIIVLQTGLREYISEIEKMVVSMNEKQRLTEEIASIMSN